MPLVASTVVQRPQGSPEMSGAASAGDATHASPTAPQPMHHLVRISWMREPAWRAVRKPHARATAPSRRDTRVRVAQRCVPDRIPDRGDRSCGPSRTRPGWMCHLPQRVVRTTAWGARRCARAGGVRCMQQPCGDNMCSACPLLRMPATRTSSDSAARSTARVRGAPATPSKPRGSLGSQAHADAETGDGRRGGAVRVHHAPGAQPALKIKSGTKSRMRIDCVQ